MNIKEKFTPETHQTRCGKPWRWLDIKGQKVVAIAVNDYVENLFIVDSHGVASLMFGLYPSDEEKGLYDLIEITSAQEQGVLKIKIICTSFGVYNKCRTCDFNIEKHPEFKGLNNEPKGKYWFVDSYACRISKPSFVNHIWNFSSLKRWAMRKISNSG